MKQTTYIEIADHELQRVLRTLSSAVRDHGGRLLLVGGSVRDSLLGMPAKDLDLEVYGVQPEALRLLVAQHYPLDLVGQSFGVLKLKGLPVDVALPRTESKRGLGHRGFEVHSQPDLSLEEAAGRRDFTVNAMAWDPESNELLDPYGGAQDLRDGRLRHVSQSFAEDPLRVLRAMQMAARFELQPAAETVELCRNIEPEGLAPERCFEEWRKLLVLGRKPSLGLAFLQDCGWVRYYPELQALIGCEQDPEWHPEGDVWVHTLHVLDAFAGERLGDAWEDLVLGFACLCHDLGKPSTSFVDKGRIRSPGHEEQGEAPTRSFLARLTQQQALVDQVVPLVREHLKPIQLYKAGAGAGAVRRLANRVGRIDRLVRLARADHRGRPPKPWDGFPAGEWLLARAKDLTLEKQAPKALVQGRHLIELGLQPGPHFGPLLAACFEAQLDGDFADVKSGIAFARELLAAQAEESAAGPGRVSN